MINTYRKLYWSCLNPDKNWVAKPSDALRSSEIRIYLSEWSNIKVASSSWRWIMATSVFDAHYKGNCIQWYMKSDQFINSFSVIVSNQFPLRIKNSVTNIFGLTLMARFHLCNNFLWLDSSCMIESEGVIFVLGMGANYCQTTNVECLTWL